MESLPWRRWLWTSWFICLALSVLMGTLAFAAQWRALVATRHASLVSLVDRLRRDFRGLEEQHLQIALTLRDADPPTVRGPFRVCRADDPACPDWLRTLALQQVSDDGAVVLLRPQPAGYLAGRAEETPVPASFFVRGVRRPDGAVWLVEADLANIFGPWLRDRLPVGVDVRSIPAQDAWKSPFSTDISDVIWTFPVETMQADDSYPFDELLLTVDNHGPLGALIRLWVCIASLAVVLFAALAFAMRRADVRMRGQFMDELAHELRRPLSRLQLYSDIVAHGLVDDDREYRQKMLHEAQGLGQVLDGLVALGCGRGPRATLCDLADLARQAIQQVDGAAAATFDLRPVPVLVDPDWTRQAIVNLVQNAQLHGEGLTRLSVARHDDLAVIEVEDSGRGMLHSRLFEPYVREGHSGLGLGLSLTRRYVEQQGGRLTASRAPHGGARFTVILPAAREVPREFVAAHRG